MVSRGRLTRGARQRGNEIGGRLSRGNWKPRRLAGRPGDVARPISGASPSAVPQLPQKPSSMPFGAPQLQQYCRRPVSAPAGLAGSGIGLAGLADREVTGLAGGAGGATGGNGTGGEGAGGGGGASAAGWGGAGGGETGRAMEVWLMAAGRGGAAGGASCFFQSSGVPQFSHQMSIARFEWRQDGQRTGVPIVFGVPIFKTIRRCASSGCSGATRMSCRRAARCRPTLGSGHR
jgi:hypothetical protein